MASAAERTDPTYTMYGFDSDLDWRQTCFLEPLPPSRYCTYCGVVSANTRMLPCCHIVCDSCYSQCLARNSTCVLDAQRFRQKDVARMTYSSQDVASKYIRCWNANRGCEISGPSFQILEHYRMNCQYHIISCIRCEKSVIHGNVVAHLARGCSPDTTFGYLPQEAKQASLAEAKQTERQLEGQDTEASGILDAANQQRSLTHKQHTNLDRREIESKPCDQETHIPQALQPGKVTDQNEPSSSCSTTQSTMDDSCKPPVVACGVSSSTECPEPVQNKLSASRNKDTLEAIKKACIYLEGTMQEWLDTVRSQQAEPSATNIQEGSVSPSEGSGVPMANVVTPETGTVPGDLASSGAERLTTVAQDSSKTGKAGMDDPLQAFDSSAPSHGEFEYGLSQQDNAGSDSRQATTSGVSFSTTPTSASAHLTDEALLLLLSGYINSISRFVQNICEGIDEVNDALGKHEPEDLAFILKVCEEAREEMKQECLAWGAMRNQIQQQVTKVFDAIRGRLHYMGDEDLFEDPVGRRIDRLMNMGKHILRQRLTESVPVQWHLERWSELKTRAIATGKATDHYINIRTTFFGYVIVPGLLLEKTASKLVLRSSSYVRSGDLDDLLEWPIAKQFTLSILHPKDKEKIRFLVVDTRTGRTERYARPGNASIEPILSTKSLKANFLDVNGYVEDDKVLLQFEVK